MTNTLPTARSLALRKEAKALRAKARRLEAKGWKYAQEAGDLRDRADGLRWEALYSDQHGG